MRTNTHIIDTKSIKKLLQSFPDHWVVRELSERDYGIDLVIEIFVEKGIDKHGHKTYDSSGCVCNIQVKGTNKKLKINKKYNSINYSFKKEALLYVERFATPFLLIRVDVSSATAPTYYVWLQRYIKDVLDVEYPNWRENKKKSYTIKIPVENSLIKNSTKIEDIASRIKYIEELLEYREVFTSLDHMLDAMGTGNHSSSPEVYQHINTQVNKISRLITLLSRNHCNVNLSSIQDLSDFIGEVESGNKNIEKLINYPHKFSLGLLSNSIDSAEFIENILAENESAKVY